MSSTLLLIIIFICFISLGLPDGLLGAGWPSIHLELNVPLSFAGYVTMIIAGGTIVSSLLSDKIISKFGTKWIIVISIALTALGLFGFSFSHSYFMLCLFAIPYGLGAGAIDSALNNYVAVNYKPKQMNWLHSFWGVGALTGPYVMGAFLNNGQSWTLGYLTIAIVQSVILILVLSTLKLWDKSSSLSRDEKPSKTPEKKKKTLSFFQVWGLKGAAFLFIGFFAYCSLETTAGLWAASYLTINRGISASLAATFASLFYIGITAGRFASGFVSGRLGDKLLIRIGLGVMLLGAILIIIPSNSITPLIGLVTFGLGCAPIYPALIHETPGNFGKENSQAVIGIQMASAYVGSTFMPPVFGYIAEYVDILYFPYYLLFFLVLLVIMVELLNGVMKKKKSLEEATKVNEVY